MKRSTWTSVLTLFALLGAASAQDYVTGDLQVSHPHALELPPVSRIGAVYMTIANRGAGDDRLIAAATPAAERAEVHTHVHAGGMMKMQPVESVDLPAGHGVTFEPGGLHVMLMQLRAPLKAGETFPMTLSFERAGTLEVTVTVEARGRAGTMGHPQRSGQAMPAGQGGHGMHGGEKKP